MKYSTRLSDAVHILTLIALNESPTLSSGAIAESIHTNPSYVRQFMAKLKIRTYQQLSGAGCTRFKPQSRRNYALGNL